MMPTMDYAQLSNVLYKKETLAMTFIGPWLFCMTMDDDGKANACILVLQVTSNYLAILFLYK